jgi:hypothetical protein
MSGVETRLHAVGGRSQEPYLASPLRIMRDFRPDVRREHRHHVRERVRRVGAVRLRGRETHGVAHGGKDGGPAVGLSGFQILKRVDAHAGRPRDRLLAQAEAEALGPHARADLTGQPGVSCPPPVGVVRHIITESRFRSSE